MPYNTKPTASYVHDFAKERMEFWGQEQATQDEFFWAMYMRRGKDKLTVQHITGDIEKPDRLQTGYAAQMVDHDLVATGMLPTMRISPPVDTIKERKKIDGQLEPWLNGVVRNFMRPWRNMARDVRLLGRGYMVVSPLVRLFAEGDYADKSKKLADLTRKYVAASIGDGENIRSQMDGVLKEIEGYEKDPANFPIRATYYDARCTYPLPDEERPWSEIVHVRKMTARQIEEEYGKNKVPQSLQPPRDDKGRYIKSDSRELNVYHYWNYFWYACVVGDDDDAKEITVWRHGMGENPVIVQEGDLFPEGVTGLRWKSSLFDFSDVLQALDISLSDIMHIQRRFAFNQVFMTLDPEARHANVDDPRVVGHPEQLIDIKPNDPYIYGYLQEKLSLAPVPTASQDVWLLTNWLNQYANTIALRAEEQGRLPNSQTSAVTYAIQLDESKRRLHPVLDEMDMVARKMHRLVIKSALRFLEEFPQAKKIYVHTARAGALGCEASDLKGYEMLGVPRFSDVSEVSEAQKIRNAQVKLGIGIDPITVYQEDLGYENGQLMMERSQKYRLQEMVFQKTLDQVGAIMDQLMSQMPANAANQMANQLPQLPPEVMEILMEEGLMAPLQMPEPQPMQALGPGTTPGSLGNASQILSNLGSVGQPQEMSQLAAQEMLV